MFVFDILDRKVHASIVFTFSGMVVLGGQPLADLR